MNKQHIAKRIEDICILWSLWCVHHVISVAHQLRQCLHATTHRPPGSGTPWCRDRDIVDDIVMWSQPLDICHTSSSSSVHVRSEVSGCNATFVAISRFSSNAFSHQIHKSIKVIARLSARTLCPKRFILKSNSLVFFQLVLRLRLANRSQMV